MKNSSKMDDYTRVDKRTGKRSTLDHIHMNYKCSCTIGLIDHCVSDHRLLEIDVSMPKTEKNQQIYQSELVNYEKVCEQVTQEIMKKNLNEMDFKTLTDTIRGEIKNATTHKTRRTTGNIKEGWSTTDIKHKITERDRAYVKKCRFPEIHQYEDDF
ncbi:hypothetical protein HHI36_017425 [Cryptolaemus montrouzieri]|uniref:Uncharacterized protein n=1 Tax=Cryptolaemus montrouzieri TaxID=559131 RepID=A0ABD2NMG4_9CUCU